MLNPRVLRDNKPYRDLQDSTIGTKGGWINTYRGRRNAIFTLSNPP